MQQRVFYIHVKLCISLSIYLLCPSTSDIKFMYSMEAAHSAPIISNLIYTNERQPWIIIKKGCVYTQTYACMRIQWQFYKSIHFTIHCNVEGYKCRFHIINIIMSICLYVCKINNTSNIFTFLSIGIQSVRSENLSVTEPHSRMKWRRYGQPEELQVCVF